MASRWSSSAPDEPVLNSDREKAHRDQPGHFLVCFLGLVHYQSCCNHRL